MTVEDGEAYRRGQAEGVVNERLDQHDRHFAAINGQLGSVAARMQDLVLSVQRLADQQASSIEQTRQVNTALREQSVRAWSPWAKAISVAGVLLTFVTILIMMYLGLRAKT